MSGRRFVFTLTRLTVARYHTFGSNLGRALYRNAISVGAHVHSSLSDAATIASSDWLQVGLLGELCFFTHAKESE